MRYFYHKLPISYYNIYDRLFKLLHAKRYKSKTILGRPLFIVGGGATVKVTVILCLLACALVLPESLTAQSDWWKVIPPIIVSPAPNEQFDQDEGVVYCWMLADSVRAAYVSHYEIQFANAPDYPIGVYDPDVGGGTCDWHASQLSYSTCWTYSAGHQENHEPIYWRVRTFYIDGIWSNWAVSYHRVGSIDSIPDPLTITEPAINWHSCSPTLHHEWIDDPDAVEYEYGFSQARPNVLHLFEDCTYHPRDPIVGNGFSCIHDCVHLPIYFLVRGVYDDGHGGTIRSNWAITYYLMWDDCILCNSPIGVEEKTWGAIKQIYR